MAKKKATRKPTASEVAKKIDESEPGTATAQTLIPDAFAPRIPEVERAIAMRIKETKNRRKAETAITAANETARAAMVEAGVDAYKSYDHRVEFAIDTNATPLRFRELKGDEASPCTKE